MTAAHWFTQHEAGSFPVERRRSARVIYPSCISAAGSNSGENVG
jgi:hypothetical protein